MTLSIVLEKWEGKGGACPGLSYVNATCIYTCLAHSCSCSEEDNSGVAETSSMPIQEVAQSMFALI